MRLGDLRAIFGDPTLRRRTLVGMTLGMVGQIGLWSIGLFTPELVRGSLLAHRQSELAGVVARDKGINVSLTGLDLERLARASAATEAEAVRQATAWKRQVTVMSAGAPCSRTSARSLALLCARWSPWAEGGGRPSPWRI